MNRKAVAVVFTVSVVMAEASCVRQRSAEGASQLGSIGERRFRDSQPRTPLHRKPGSVPAVTPVNERLVGSAGRLADVSREERVSHGLRAPLGQCQRPIPGQEVRTHAFRNESLLLEARDDQLDHRRGSARMHEAEVDATKSVVFGQQKHVLVRPPHSFPQVSFGALHVFDQQPMLGIVEIQPAAVGLDVLPREEFARLLGQRRAVLGEA